MTRKKIKLAFIESGSARKASFKKRMGGLTKKMMELTTLCGLNGCIIIFGPYDNRPVVWPSLEVAEHLLVKYEGMTEIRRFKKLTNQEDYLKDKTTKEHKQLRKVQRKHDGEEVANNLMHQANGGEDLNVILTKDLCSFESFAAEKRKEIQKVIEYLKQTEGNEASLDKWYPDMMQSTQNVAGSSSTMSEMQLPRPYVGGLSSGNLMKLPQIRGSSGRSSFGLPLGSHGGGFTGLPLGISGGSHGGHNTVVPHGFGGSSHIRGDLGLPQGFAGNRTMGTNMFMPSEVYGGIRAGSTMWMPHGFAGGSIGGTRLSIGIPRSFDEGRIGVGDKGIPPGFAGGNLRERELGLHPGCSEGNGEETDVKLPLLPQELAGDSTGGNAKGLPYGFLGSNPEGSHIVLPQQLSGNSTEENATGLLQGSP